MRPDRPAELMLRPHFKARLSDTLARRGLGRRLPRLNLAAGEHPLRNTVPSTPARHAHRPGHHCQRHHRSQRQPRIEARPDCRVLRDLRRAAPIGVGDASRCAQPAVEFP
jgi:hypothetical protein